MPRPPGRGIVLIPDDMKPLLILLAALTAPACHGAESDVTVVNPADGASLAGTLARPAEKPLAAVVLATGSGAQNRDEEIYGHRPFKTLSDFLVERGYAVLRLDDRGVGGSTGARSDMTTRTFAGDIACAVEYLDSACGRQVPVGVIGHSEGGIIALLNAVGNPSCDFIVTLAGPAWRGDSTVMAQSRAAAMAATGRWDMEHLQRRLLDIAAGDMLPAIAAGQMMAAIGAEIPEQMAIPQVAEAMRRQLAAMTTPWYREFLRYDPAADIARVDKPWLALNGDRDTQVLPANLETIRELNPAVDTILLERHNHLFQKTDNGNVAAYVSGGQAPSAETLEAIVSWLDSKVAKR